MLLVRGYSAAYGAANSLRPTLSTGSLKLGMPHPSFRGAFESQNLWGRQTLVVLHGPSTYAAAVDFESKFSEAALGQVQLADFRNFAHGRHLWLAKKGSETGILALVTEEDRELAQSLLALIPKEIPTVRILLPGRGVTACIVALAAVMRIAGEAGQLQGIDPGDPGVPSFGRKIYHLRAFNARSTSSSDLSSREAAAIERKSRGYRCHLSGSLDDWREAYRNFSRADNSRVVRGTHFRLRRDACDEKHRFDPLPFDVASQLVRLLKSGAILGIATGRGKSVKEASVSLSVRSSGLVSSSVTTTEEMSRRSGTTRGRTAPMLLTNHS